MSRLAIEFPGKYVDNQGNTENLEEQAAHPEQLYMWDGTAITYEQASPCLSDALQLLGQLRTNSAAKALDMLKNRNPDFPPFSFHVRGYLGAQADSLGSGELPVQSFQRTPNANDFIYPDLRTAEAEGSGHGYVTFSHTSPPPIETIDPSLLTAQIVDSDKLSRRGMYSGDDAGTYNGNPSEDEDNGSLFVPPASDNVPPPETPNGQNPLCGSNGSSPMNDVDPGFRTPVSDNSPSTARYPKEADRSNRSSRSKLLVKASNKTSTRQKSTKPKSRKRKPLDLDQENKRIASEFEKLRLSISQLPVANTLYELSDQDLRALLLGEGLTKDNLPEYVDQNSCVWQEKRFWVEDELDLCIMTNHSAKERFCQIFQHTCTLAGRATDQKLRLRMSETLLYLSLESLKQDTQRDMQLRMLDNTDQRRASTLSMDHLLERAYPDVWNCGGIEAKKRLRTQLHEHLRNGTRCWQVAGALGLGALFAGGNLLIKMIKNHSKYTTPRLDAVINYIINAHPHVVSLYHDFDDLVKQILHIRPLATQPSRQTIDDKLSLLPGQGMGPEHVEENWQPVDSIALSKALVQSHCLDYIQF